MSQKGLTPIFIILLIILGISGYILYSNKTSYKPKTTIPDLYEQSNWQIFKDTKFKY